jgi:hypothetical protein
MDSVKPRFAVDAHLRELFANEACKEPESAVDAETCLVASEHPASLQKGICDEMGACNELQVPLTPTSSSPIVAPVQLPTSLEDALLEELTTTNEQRHDWVEQGGKPDREVIRGCNGYLEYPFEKMTISSFPPISILAKWNSMKEDAKEFFSSFQRNSLNSTRNTRFLAEHAQWSHAGDVLEVFQQYLH